MAENQNPNAPQTTPPSSSSSSKLTSEIRNGNHAGAGFPAQEKIHFPNPPDLTNPDPATLRDQWRYAIRQYSRWYSHAWGTAILAGLSFFALGWIIKGSNPLPSFKSDSSPSDDDAKRRSS
ncbi:hypothetical protein SLA2020_523040 [Shorea laevis]